jgi:hypothetical protein
MPIQIHAGAPTLLIRRSAYERSGIVRSALDQRLGLTADEFRVEGEAIVIGPVFDEQAFGRLVADLEQLGLVYYEDFFELSGNWPDWVAVFAGSTFPPGRNSPSQPHS